MVRPGYVCDTDGSGEGANKNFMVAAALELSESINPNILFASELKVSSMSSATTKKEANNAVVIDMSIQNVVLAKLVVDGERRSYLLLADPYEPDLSYSIKCSSATTNIRNVLYIITCSS